MLARIMRRRMNSAATPVTIMLLTLAHLLRFVMAEMRWFGYDGRITTVVSSSEFESTTLADFFSSNIALRLNGNVKVLFSIKMVPLLSNAVPLIFSENMAPDRARSRHHRLCEIEKALSIRVCNLGGMGTSSLYECCTAKEKHGKPLEVLNPYELVRLGYVVVSNRYLISWEDWFVLCTTAPFHRVIKWRDRRVMVFELHDCADPCGCHNFQVSKNAQVINVANFVVRCPNWWDIDARCIQ